jgi:hypothetical protein
MLFKEIIRVYTDNHSKQKKNSTEWRIYWKLKQVVHVITTRLQRAKLITIVSNVFMLHPCKSRHHVTKKDGQSWSSAFIEKAFS